MTRTTGRFALDRSERDTERATVWLCSQKIDPYPPTVNDADLWRWATRVAAAASSEGAVREIAPTMGGEDFSFIAQEVPSVFLALGQGATDFAPSGDDGAPLGPFDTTVTVHNGRFVLHEDLLRRGTALHAHLALQFLDREWANARTAPS